MTVASPTQGHQARNVFPSILMAGLLLVGGPASAEQVDAELLLLVDTSIVVSNQNFNDLLEGFATAFESGPMIDSLENNSSNGIAASLVFFGSVGTPAVQIPWMKLDDAASGQTFADLIRNVTRPTPNFVTSVADGLDFASTQFGPSSGFESGTQAINLTTETFVLLGDTAAEVSDASDAALATGVDVINAITVGTFNAAGSTAYYESNIIGGQSGGSPGSVSNVPNYASLPGAASTALNVQVISLIPEPRVALLLLLGLGVLSRRSRS